MRTPQFGAIIRGGRVCGWLLPAWLVATGLGAAAPEHPLIEAARTGDAATVRAVLRQGADARGVTAVNARQADGTSALHWAAHRDNLEMVDLLIRAGAQVSAANRYGVMPLSLACTNGSAAVIERLLDAGADPNAALPGGETPLMTVARTGSVDAVRRLIARGADVNARESARGQTALMWAAAHGNAAVVPLLLEAGADISARSHGPVSNADPGAKGLQFRDYSRQGRLDDFTALLFAARAGHIVAVRALLAGGADPNEAAPDGSTVLVVAAVNAHWELAALLLDHGADPNASLQGWTPLHQVVRTRTLNIGQFPHPVPTGRLTSLDLARKLVEFGADVNARMTKELRDGYRGGRFNRLGATPMLLAAKGADFEMMRLLAAAGADPTLTNRTRTTVLMAASGVGMFYVEEDSGTNEDALEAVKVALELGGDVTAADDNGNTALHGGAWRGSNPIVQLLIERGARLDVRNKGGFTPLQVANGEETTNAGLQRRPETVALLRQLMMARGLPVDGPSEVAAGRH